MNINRRKFILGTVSLAAMAIAMPTNLAERGQLFLTKFTALYGLRAIDDYDGPTCRVRWMETGEEMDIYGECKPMFGRVPVILYDQSGNRNHLVSAE